MSLADTSRAIGAATDMLATQLAARTALNVTIGHPQPSGSPTNPRLNLFLFESALDPSMRSMSPDPARPAPLWMVLRFLVTAFDEHGASDSADAHRNLGLGLRALQQLSHLPIEDAGPADAAALRPNPEPLKITFLDAPSEMLGRVMQGSDETYRYSMAFELRPIMIATGEPSSPALLVGVDYTAPPADRIIGTDGIHLDVVPGLAPLLTRRLPAAVAIGDTLALFGEGLAAGMVARLGSIDLPLAGADSGMTALIDGALVDGDVISAGPHPLAVVRLLSGGRRRSSNLLEVRLLPTVDSVGSAAFTADDGSTSAHPLRKGTFEIDGTLLSTELDDVMVALYADGSIAASTDQVVALPGPAQTRMRASVAGVPPGSYRVIVRINGSQALNSPLLEVT